MKRESPAGSPANKERQNHNTRTLEALMASTAAAPERKQDLEEIPGPAQSPEGPTVGESERTPVAEKEMKRRITNVHRIAAGTFAAGLLVFGILGFAGGLGFLYTQGEEVLGLSSNGLLSAISVVTALVLLAAAVKGGKRSSTVMTVIGVLFLVSGLLNLAVLRTEFNILAFEMSNVVFSVVAGFFLLLMGAYGRFTGNLPEASPYRHHAAENEGPNEYDERPQTPREIEAEKAMREAEIAVVYKRATPEQAQRVTEMGKVRTRPERRRVWMEMEDAPRS